MDCVHNARDFYKSDEWTIEQQYWMSGIRSFELACRMFSSDVVQAYNGRNDQLWSWKISIYIFSMNIPTLKMNNFVYKISTEKPPVPDCSQKELRFNISYENFDNVWPTKSVAKVRSLWDLNKALNNKTTVLIMI